MAWRTEGLRGDVLEGLINITNDYYRTHGFARIDKIPTSVKVMEINERSQITMGYFEKRSTVDYIGMAQGIGICFDAKETNTLNLPLTNIHEHQIEFMQDFRKQGGISFLLAHFKKPNEYFLIPLELVEEYLEKAERKSIPYAAMERCIPVGMFQGKYLNYLASVNVYLEMLEGLEEGEKEVYE